MEDFSYTDTSGEPTNQIAAHERRLQAFMAALRRDIGEGGRYRLVPSAQDGAAFKVIGGIQKTSTLVQWAKVAVIDVGAKSEIYRMLQGAAQDGAFWPKRLRKASRAMSHSCGRSSRRYSSSNSRNTHGLV